MPLNLRRLKPVVPALPQWDGNRNTRRHPRSNGPTNAAAEGGDKPGPDRLCSQGCDPTRDLATIRSAQLWRLLVKITPQKARARGRHHTAGLRDAGVEAGEEWLADAVSREPGPLEAVMLVDQIETLLHGLPPLHCHVLDPRLQGVGPSEIAARLGVSRQTVHRALTMLQGRLEGGS